MYALNRMGDARSQARRRLANVFVAVLLLAGAQYGAAHDAFDAVKCDGDVAKALIGSKLANARIADIEKAQGHKVGYPMIGDSDLNVAKLYGMLPADAGETCAGRTPANNATVRTVFVIGPDKKIKLMLVYPMTTGRNFDEVLRVLDSMQLTAKHQVATPVNWKAGNDVIIVPAVSNEEAAKKYPAGWNTVLPYLRVVAQPQ